MFGFKDEPLFEVDRSRCPPSCFPTSLDKTSLVDITAVGDTWRKYMDKETGKVHDGAEYYRQAVK